MPSNDEVITPDNISMALAARDYAVKQICKQKNIDFDSGFFTENPLNDKECICAVKYTLANTVYNYFFYMKETNA
jgi:hypothetical protein